jgi:hypothetical protein
MNKRHYSDRDKSYFEKYKQKYENLPLEERERLYSQDGMDFEVDENIPLIDTFSSLYSSFKERYPDFGSGMIIDYIASRLWMNDALYGTEFLASNEFNEILDCIYKRRVRRRGRF